MYIGTKNINSTTISIFNKQKQLSPSYICNICFKKKTNKQNKTRLFPLTNKVLYTKFIQLQLDENNACSNGYLIIISTVFLMEKQLTHFASICQKRHCLMSFRNNGPIQKVHLIQTNIAPKRNGSLQKSCALQKNFLRIFTID